MKTLLILALAAVLAAGAFLSKPSQANFTDFIKTQTQPAQSQSLSGLGKQILGGLIMSSQQQLTYHDHGLWATEEVNGQTQYYGAFSHWWRTGSAATPAAG